MTADPSTPYIMLQAETIRVQMTESKANSITASSKGFQHGGCWDLSESGLPNEADAEDILQDVFYQLLGNKEPIDQIAAWLFTVARNKIIDENVKSRPLAYRLFSYSDPEDVRIGRMDGNPDGRLL